VTHTIDPSHFFPTIDSSVAAVPGSTGTPDADGVDETDHEAKYR